MRFSALNAGLTFLPLGIAFFAGSLIAPRIIPFLEGQPEQGHTLQLALAYGQAFVAALFAIIALAVATLVCVSLLPSPKPGQRETVTPTLRNSSQGKSLASSTKVR